MESMAALVQPLDQTRPFRELLNGVLREPDDECPAEVERWNMTPNLAQ